MRRVFRRRHAETPCTIDVQNTFESLHAHVRLDDGSVIRPGDTVHVHGEPITVPFGETRSFRRRATIERAGPLERAWTRLTGDLGMMELCEFSFSGEHLS